MTGGAALGHGYLLPDGGAPESPVMSAGVDASSGICRIRRRLVVLLGAVAIAGLTACGAGTRALPVQRDPSPTARLPGSAPVHVAVIVMENHEYGDIIGSRSAPYINSLARRYGLATGMYAITHPSLPNYLALTGGATFGIGSDCTDCSVHATSIVDQLEQAHLAWRAYMQDLPRSCFTGASAGEYAKKHDPFVYYTRITGNPARCANIVPLARLAADERSQTHAEIRLDHPQPVQRHARLLDLHRRPVPRPARARAAAGARAARAAVPHLG